MRPTTRCRALAVAGGLAALSLALTACGDDAPPGATATATATELAAPSFGTSADTWPAASVTFTTTDGDDRVLSVRVADTPERRQQGLMQVASVPAGTGMLFLFPSPIDGGFWMKDTRVPLDIAYIADGVVRSVMQMAPCLDYDVASEDCPSYRPGVPFDTTVEVAQGWFAEVGVTEGARVATDAADAVR